jgi:hypothetical protein
MKPTLDVRNRRDSIMRAAATGSTFPKIGFNYRATGFAGLEGRGAVCRRSSFHAISRDYFTSEASLHFAHEAVLFLIMMMTVALPLLNASIAVLHLIRLG